MTGNSSDSDPICRMVDMLVEDILETSDEDLLKEVRERGEDPKAIADHIRVLFGKAEVAQGRQRLLDARTEVNADVSRRVASTGKDPVAARQRLNAIMQRFPGSEAQLTMAARKGDGMSDNDVKSMLADLEELGVTGEDED